MKFPFLKGLFGQNSQVQSQTTTQTTPEKNIDELINATVKRAMKQIPDDHVSLKEVMLEEPGAMTKKREVKLLNFQVISEMNGSTFEVDKDYGISRITWNGTVDLPTVRKLVTLGADSVEFHKYKRLLLDRSKLTEFDTQARVWIKGLLKTRAKRIVRMVNKLAIINPKSSRGSIFSNFIASAIKLVMPNLDMRKFNSEQEAIDWLVS